MLFLHSRSRRIALLAFLNSLLFAATPATAQSDPIIEICSTTGCNTVSTILAPCGGGATNSSLQQDLTYTVTPVLGSCECNSQFFNAFSSCLACITSQAKSSPAIDNQQNWVAQCKSYGFNFTEAPINFTRPTSGDTGSGSGLSGGAIAGIVIGVLVVAALAGGLFFKNRKRRTKGSIFARPYSAAGTDTEDAGSTQPTFNAYSNYNDAGYPAKTGAYTDQDPSYYNYSQQQDQQHYGSNQNEDDNDAMMMNNLRHSNYIPPPIPMSPAAVAAVGSLTNLGSPRPGDEYPQNRPKNKDWEGRQYEFNSDLISTDQLLNNDKAAIDEEGEELEPPRARDRYVNDRDDFTSRRSLTPPRANMQSYRDEFTRPSFEREPRNSGSERGSISGINLIRGTGGYDSNEDDSAQGSPENARRRRAAELFAAEGTRR
ncbi:hypothetical protein BGX27_007932 [Mortierella sp. AM989]|nr:hypothetical protein BGX27_007932 [Mortierella sp. AM989]